MLNSVLIFENDSKVHLKNDKNMIFWIQKSVRILRNSVVVLRTRKQNIFLQHFDTNSVFFFTKLKSIIVPTLDTLFGRFQN